MDSERDASLKKLHVVAALAKYAARLGAEAAPGVIPVVIITGGSSFALAIGAGIASVIVCESGRWSSQKGRKMNDGGNN